MGVQLQIKQQDSGIIYY